MEYVKAWSTPTLIFYVCFAVLIAFLFRLAIKAKKDNKVLKIFKLKFNTKYIYYTLIYVLFILFTCFRVIGPGIGGEDSIVYMGYFKSMKFIPFNLKAILTFDVSEYLYYNLMVFIRTIGGNFFTFSFIIYSIMILSYIFVIDKSWKDEKNCFFIILAFIPLLKSLNIVRNCFAAAIGFIGIELINKKKWLAYVAYFILGILAFLHHYSAIILIVFGLFCVIVPEKLITNRKWLIILNVICVILSIVAVPVAKHVLVNTGYAIYLENVEISLYGYVPIFVFYVLMLLDKKIVDYLKEIGHFVYYKVMVFLSFVLPIFILLNGANRILLFFELPRYILYADLYTFYRKKMPKKLVKWYDVIAIIGVIVWLVFRIWRIWESYALMPYYNYLFI